MALRRKRHDTRFNRKQPIEHTAWWPFVARYLESCRIKHLSPDTLRRHDSAVRRFVVWCEERSLDTPDTITKPILERYQSHLFYYRKSNGIPLSAASQQLFLSSVQLFFRWLVRENLLLTNPASELVLPKKPRQLPRHVLSVEEVEQIIGSIDVTEPLGLRDRVIVELLYATGMRRVELARLKAQHLDYSRSAVLIASGKGDKDRYVPLGRRAQYWVQRYLDHTRPLLATPPDDGTLLLSDWGEPLKLEYLTFLVRRLLKNAGITKPGSCHLFRHACATHMLEGGADIRFVQALLGHADLSTTQIYTHVSMDKLREIHAASHPLEREAVQRLLAKLDEEAESDSEPVD